MALQFNVSNTLPDTVLEQTSVIMQPSGEADLTEDFIIPIPLLTAAAPGVVYVSFTRNSPAEYPLAAFQCTLKFISKEVDPSSGEPEDEGYEDEYQLEEVELGPGGDYIVPTYATFAGEWEKMKSSESVTETFALSAMGSIKGMKLPSSLSFHLLISLGLFSQPHAILSSRFSTWNRWVGRRCRNLLQCIHSAWQVSSLGERGRC